MGSIVARTLVDGPLSAESTVALASSREKQGELGRKVYAVRQVILDSDAAMDSRLPHAA